MRFDDSLKTVLAADASTAFGAQAAFRQIADLMARGRIEPDEETLGRLRQLKAIVPQDVRAATARNLALGTPPAALVALFAEDDPPVAAAILRVARLSEGEWVALLPRIGPTGRSVLRARSDLGSAVERALESFGSTDFSLGHDAPAGKVIARPIDRPVAPPIGEGPFVPLGKVTEALPIVAEARRMIDAAPAPVDPDPQRFEIADLVDRIAAFQRDRGGAPVLDAAPAPVGRFRFETDAKGAIRWIDAVPRGAVIGVSLADVAPDAMPQVDGVAAGAFRRRAAFTDARLSVGGTSALAGDWRISAVPVFDSATGRFTGYRGGARRPRSDESATRDGGRGGSEGLRRLVHELRTPTNAIAGFSELIETQLLGPVAPVYRERAVAIRTQVTDLIAAIDDLDLAARIEGDALDLRAGETPLAPLLARLQRDLAPLVALRGCTLAVSPVPPDLAAECDDRALERLLARLLAAVVSAAGVGERLQLDVVHDGVGAVNLVLDRPRALASVPEAALLSLDAEREADLPGAPLLGTGFALRLARNLASELGGSLAIDVDRLTLRLPAGSIGDMGQASTV